MKSVGLFEAKTKLSGLCDEVSRTGTPLLLQRRGHPLVIISPAPPVESSDRPGIWDAWQSWNEQDATDAEFPTVWEQRVNKQDSPLGE